MQGWHRDSCVSQLSAKSSQGRARGHLRDQFFTSMDKKRLTSWWVMKLNQVENVGSCLVCRVTHFNEQVAGCWATPVRLWRSIACHLWGQREQTLRKACCHLKLFVEWASQLAAGTSMPKKSFRGTWAYWMSWRTSLKSFHVGSGWEWQH